jgi:vancomycin resistance protein YoaR
VVLLVVGLALLAGGCYVAAYLAAGDKVPVGTSVAGVEIGGRSSTSAVSALRDQLGHRARAPFTVVVNGRTMQVSPERAGLDVDYAASVRAAGAGRSWAPGRLWTYYTGGARLDPVTVLDRRRLAALVGRLDGSDGSAPTDGAVRFGRDGFVVSQPQDGLRVDLDGAAAAFEDAYLGDDPRVQLPLVATTAEIDTTAVQRFVTGFANPAMASPVTLLLGRESVRLPPSSYGRLLGAEKVGHRLRATVRPGALAALVNDRLGGRPAAAPRDASVALVDGRPQVVGARAGLVFAPADVASALVTAIETPARTARVRATRQPAPFTNADARALGITDLVSSGTVRLPGGSSGRSLARAVARLDGTVLRPGDSLSLRDRLGDAVPADATADRLATAVFDAAWLGGLAIGSHATLPSYTGAYPMGRDATLRDGQDLTVVDDTSYGVLVTVTTQAHSLTVGVWSAPRWTVTSSHAAPVDVVPAGRVVRHGHGCRPRTGHPGFDVTVTRTFARSGATTTDHTSSYAVHYEPVPAVVCRRR